MAVYKKTYFSPVGDTSFVDPALALGVIYSFSQQGQNDFIEDPWDEFSEPLPGHFMYNVANGHIRVSPETPFLVGSLTVIYKAIGIPYPDPPEPPVICENPTPIVGNLVGESMIQFSLPGIGNYIYDLIPGGGSCGDTPLQSGSVMGGDYILVGPLEAGSYKACVRRDCGGGMYSGAVASNSVAIVIPPWNFGARKVPADMAIKIVNIIGVPYTLRYGSLPLITASQEMRGRHEGFTLRNIIVKLTVKKKQQVVVALYRNGTLLQFIPVYLASAGPASVTFNPIAAVPTDDIFVALDYT